MRELIATISVLAVLGLAFSAASDAAPMPGYLWSYPASYYPSLPELPVPDLSDPVAHGYLWSD